MCLNSELRPRTNCIERRERKERRDRACIQWDGGWVEVLKQRKTAKIGGRTTVWTHHHMLTCSASALSSVLCGSMSVLWGLFRVFDVPAGRGSRSAFRSCIRGNEKCCPEGLSHPLLSSSAPVGCLRPADRPQLGGRSFVVHPTTSDASARRRHAARSVPLGNPPRGTNHETRTPQERGSRRASP